MNRKEIRLLLRDSKAIATPTTAVMQYFVGVVFWFLVNCQTLSVQPPECFYMYILLNCLYNNNVTSGGSLFLQALWIQLGFVMLIPNWQLIELPICWLWQWNGRIFFPVSCYLCILFLKLFTYVKQNKDIQNWVMLNRIKYKWTTGLSVWGGMTFVSKTDSAG